MPCTTCKLSFNVLPCEHTTGIISLVTKKEIVENITLYLGSYLKDSSLKSFITALYYSLNKNCPCKDCIVKVMCQKGSNCDKYAKEINSLKDIAEKEYKDRLDELQKDPEINKLTTTMVAMGGRRGKIYEYKTSNLETSSLALMYYNAQVMIRIKGDL